MMRIRSSALAALIPILAGCLSHREYRHIYSLDRALDAKTEALGAPERPVMQLQRVLIPDYLDTTDILLRMGTNEIHDSATGRFAERLSSGVTHALRSDLASRLSSYSVMLVQPADRTAREIVVNVEAFDVWPTGRCVLVADWTILEAGRRTVLASDRGTFTTGAAGTVQGDGAIVTSMADAVQRLADRVASTAEALPTPKFQ